MNFTALYRIRSIRIAVKTLIVFLGLAVLWFLLFSLFRAPLPERLSEHVVDMHVHVAGLGHGGSNAFVSRELAESYKFPIYLRAFGVEEEELRIEGDKLLIGRLSKRIQNAHYIDSAVVLAMDGVIDENGELDRERTQFYVPNEYLMQELPKYSNLHFGASINPLRHDSIERLERVAANGAVLIKWLPNIMEFSPGDDRIIPFYKRVAELCLPVLTHTGVEESFVSANDILGDPEHLRMPLELGVTVIAAHVASKGMIDGELYYDRFIRLFEEFPNLYADASSLTQINRLGHLKRLVDATEVHERLLYGTDWPLQFFPLVSPYYQLDAISLREANAVRGISSQFDRDYLIKKYAGLPDHVFARFSDLVNRRCNLAS